MPVSSRRLLSLLLVSVGVACGAQQTRPSPESLPAVTATDATDAPGATLAKLDCELCVADSPSVCTRTVDMDCPKNTSATCSRVLACHPRCCPAICEGCEVRGTFGCARVVTMGCGPKVQGTCADYRACDTRCCDS
jgi:hypothetical protein